MGASYEIQLAASAIRDVAGTATLHASAPSRQGHTYGGSTYITASGLFILNIFKVLIHT